MEIQVYQHIGKKSMAKRMHGNTKTAFFVFWLVPTSCFKK